SQAEDLFMGVNVSAGNSPYKVSSGQTDTNDFVISGGSMFILSGGSASITTVSSGGTEVVSGGGSDCRARISGGVQDVNAAGTTSGADCTASGAVVGNGGQQYVGYHGMLSGGGLFSTTTAYFGTGTAIGTTVESGGYQYVEFVAFDEVIG